MQQVAEPVAEPRSQPIVWVDGELVRASEAKISVFDHGLLYGDGIYEGIRAYDGLVFQLREHLARLGRSARSLRLELPLSLEELERTVINVLRANALKDAYVRLVVTRGVGRL